MWAGHSHRRPAEVLPCLVSLGPVSGYSGGHRALPSSFSLPVLALGTEVGPCVCVCMRTQPRDPADLPLPSLAHSLEMSRIMGHLIC